MDFTNADTNALLQEVKEEFESRWSKLKKKIKSLEESLTEINSDKEDLKTKLALSREKIIVHEKKRNELASTLEDMRQRFLASPFITFITKLELKTSFLENFEDSYEPSLDTLNDDCETTRFTTLQQSPGIIKNSKDFSSNKPVNSFTFSKPDDQKQTENDESDEEREEKEEENVISNSEELRAPKMELVVHLPRIISVKKEHPVNRSELNIVVANRDDHGSEMKTAPKQQYGAGKECLICRIKNVRSNSVFASYSALNEHIYKNHPDCSPTYFRCDFGDPNCIKYYKTRKDMLKHRSRLHHCNKSSCFSKDVPKRKPIRQLKLKMCALCDKSFLYAKELQRHMKEIHDIGRYPKKKKPTFIIISEDESDSKKSPKACIMCEEIYFSESDLNDHQKEVHPSEFKEVKKLKIDVREQPKLLPKLRSRMEKQSQDSAKSSLRYKRRYSSNSIEADDSKHSCDSNLFNDESSPKRLNFC